MATLTFEEIPGQKFWEGPAGQIGSIQALEGGLMRVAFFHASKIEGGKFVQGLAHDIDSAALVALMEFFVKKASEIADKEKPNE